MIVELVGPTASGKSTLLAAATARLRDRGVPLRTASEVILGRWDAHLPAMGVARALAIQVLTLPSLVAEVVARPGLAWYLVRLSIRHGERWSFRLNCARNALRRLAVAHAVQDAGRRTPGGIFVVDEGLAHFVDVLAESGRAPAASEVDEYARRIPLPDLVVRVRPTGDARVARILARGHPRLRSRTREAVERYVRHGEVATDGLMAARALHGRSVVIDAGDGHADLDAAVEAMCGAIEEAWAERGVHGADARP